MAESECAHMLEEILAIIHEDGDQYQKAYGVAKAYEEAKVKLYQLKDKARIYARLVQLYEED